MMVAIRPTYIADRQVPNQTLCTEQPVPSVMIRYCTAWYACEEKGVLFEGVQVRFCSNIRSIISTVQHGGRTY